MKRTTFLTLALAIIVAWGAMNVPRALAGAVSAYKGSGYIALFMKSEDTAPFAAVEFKGQVVFEDGVLTKAETFLSLTLDVESLKNNGKPKQRFKITKTEIVNGTAIVTTEDNKIYTIYDIQGEAFVDELPSAELIQKQK